MKWIDTSDLKFWASKPTAKADLPLLISRLIRATTTKITSLSMPKGKSTFRGGWDGIVVTPEGTEFVPEGVSLWEFGTTGDAKGKADGDYDKRTADPDGYDMAESTFIFVTPQSWEKADEWVAEKKKEGKWKDVLVYNAGKLEEWLSIAPMQSYWLAKEIGKAPSEGVESAEDFWDNWKTGPAYELLPEVITAGRRKESAALASALKGQPHIISLQASSREEAIAFAIGSIMQFDTDQKEDILSRCVVVENEGSFKMLVANNDQLVIIARLEGTNALNRAVAKGHFVILPSGPDEQPGGATNIELSRLDRDGFTEALIKSGVSKESAESLSKESCRNITIMRRLAKFILDKPKWADAGHIRDIIPALLVGKWDENKVRDKELVSCIANEPYEDYINRLSTWKHTPGTPIYQIGSKWRISSQLDVWSHISRYITSADLDRFKAAFLRATQYVKPMLTLKPQQRFMASLYGKESEYSGWIREGLVQSLILIAVYGDEFKMSIPNGGQAFADGLVSSLFSNADSDLWRSINDIMPLIAEAAPAVFLSAVENALKGENPVISGVFEEVDNVISPTSYHTGLLWALESLAWMPLDLSRVSFVLAELDDIDPGGRLSNRPANSLTQIFLPWRPQTYATLEQRLQTLRALAVKYSDVTWKLLLKLLPQHHGGISDNNHRCRWRKFNYNEQVVTYPELEHAHSETLTICLSIVDFDTEKIVQLINLSDVSKIHMDRTVAYIRNNADRIVDTHGKIWMELNRMLGHHRSFPTEAWAIPEEDLAGYVELQDLLTPTSPVGLNKWVFETEWPVLPAGADLDISRQTEILRDKRVAALREIENEIGIKGMVDLVSSVVPQVIGDTIGYIIDTEEKLYQIYGLLSGLENAKANAANALLFRIYYVKGFQWVKNLFSRINLKTDSAAALADVLISQPPMEDVWDFVGTTSEEVQLLFWGKCDPRLGEKNNEYKEFGIQKLLVAKRYGAAIRQLSLYAADISTETAYSVLIDTAIKPSSDPVNVNWYSVTRVFMELDKRGDLDDNRMAKLELNYLPALTSHGSKRPPKVLYNELASNPDFFIEVLKWVFSPNNEEQKELEKQTKLDNPALASAGYRLLHSWRIIPGTDEYGNIDYDHLKAWVTEVRRQAEVTGRIQVADMQIANVLACYKSKDKDVWPSEEICEIIDGINTKSIRDNFRAAIFNSRGTTVRGVFDGGSQERHLAARLRSQAQKHASRWPVTSSILEALASEYEVMGREEDRQAFENDLDY